MLLFSPFLCFLLRKRLRIYEYVFVQHAMSSHKVVRYQEEETERDAVRGAAVFYGAFAVFFEPLELQRGKPSFNVTSTSSHSLAISANQNKGA